MGENPNGQEYIQGLSASGRSDVLRHISSVLAPRVEAVDREFAQKHGLKRNTGIEQTLRSFQGPSSPTGPVIAAHTAPIEAPPTLASGGLVDHALRLTAALRSR